jgi:xanthine dehydrogenase accessory factor
VDAGESSNHKQIAPRCQSECFEQTEKMQELFASLLADLEAGRDLAYCRLVETRGSTPQKAGAMMLVYPDGSQAGTLGGGCVEADVKRRALALFSAGKSEICRFQLDSDYGWDDGLICGGRMQILVEPVIRENPDAGNYFRQIAKRVSQGEGVTEAIVFDASASGLPAPQSLLFDAAGDVVASLHAAGENALGRAPIAADLKPLSARPRAYAARGVAFLPSLPRCRLIIVGGGHVGQAVAHLAADLDFDVWVVDDRADIVSAERFPRAERRIAGPMSDMLKGLDITPDTYCLIVTRGHNHDQEALFHLAQRGARYVGLIGSRRKIRLIFENLESEGVSRAALEQVYAPLGIDIGSQTVPEIAVSICAELIAHRNRGVVPGRPARL